MYRCDGWTDGPTDGPTDERPDTPSYRDVRTHLKMMWGWFVSGILLYLNNG